jgi:hypothetical protein
MSRQDCQHCGAAGAIRGQRFDPAPYPAPGRVEETWLCRKCLRRHRRELPVIPAADLPQSPDPAGRELTRRELIARLDRFCAAAGLFEVCARCHQQGTGCCPPTCRVMGTAGCDPQNRYGKTVFCAAFLCSALLNAIREIDPETGRILAWVKREIGPTEFHLYEMITRVPADAREPERPLQLPARYPAPPLDGRAELIRAGLVALTAEILAIRRL